VHLGDLVERGKEREKGWGERKGESLLPAHVLWCGDALLSK